MLHLLSKFTNLFKATRLISSESVKVVAKSVICISRIGSYSGNLQY